MPNRIHEVDVILPTLRLLSEAKDGFLYTSSLVDALEELFQPTGEDAEILQDRNDSKFTQIVRNLVSHRDTKHSIFSLGFAIYHENANGISITDEGRAFLDSLS